MYLNNLYFLFFVINVILIELLFKDTNPYVVSWLIVWSVSVVILDKLHSEKTVKVRVIESETTKCAVPQTQDTK